MSLDLSTLEVQTFYVSSEPEPTSQPPTEGDACASFEATCDPNLGCVYTADSCGGPDWCTWFCPTGIQYCSFQPTLDTCDWTKDVNC